MRLRINFSCERCGANVSRDYQHGAPEPRLCLACESQAAVAERERLRADTDRLLAKVFKTEDLA
jgi:phosphoribosyl-dephospho-CoA transferase